MLMPFQLKQQKKQSRIVFVVVLLIVSLSSYYTNHHHSNLLSEVTASRPLWSRIRYRIPFLRTNTHGKRHSASTYTPLIFFTVPKGLSSTCDEMEQIICQLEKECDIQVERLDVLRHPENEAVLNMVINSIRTISPTIGSSASSTTASATNHNPSLIQPQPPLLYHRESRQVYQVLPNPPSSATTKSSTSTTTTRWKPYIDPERIRAWAKGRYLSPFLTGGTDAVRNIPKSSAPILVPDENSHHEEVDSHMEALLLDEMALSPEQLKGKRLMEERTRAKATTTATSK